MLTVKHQSDLPCDAQCVSGRRTPSKQTSGRSIHTNPRVTQGPTSMHAVSVLLASTGVVAVAFECEVAALVFMGLAVGVARYLA
jgi:hypothetical protein